MEHEASHAAGRVNLTPVTTENSAHSYLLRLVARMLATGWVPQFEERECGDGVQVWTVTWRRKGE